MQASLDYMALRSMEAPALGWLLRSTGKIHVLGRWQLLLRQGTTHGPVALMAASRGNVVRANDPRREPTDPIRGGYGGCGRLRWFGEPLILLDLADLKVPHCTYCVRTHMKLQRRFGVRDAFDVQRNSLYECGWGEKIHWASPFPNPGECWLPHRHQAGGTPTVCVHCGLISHTNLAVKPELCPVRSARAVPGDWKTGGELRRATEEVLPGSMVKEVGPRYLVVGAGLPTFLPRGSDAANDFAIPYPPLPHKRGKLRPGRVIRAHNLGDRYLLTQHV